MNYAFIDHFQEIARAHFTVRRLERRYGKEEVRRVYIELSGTRVAAALAIAPAKAFRNWHRSALTLSDTGKLRCACIIGHCAMARKWH